MKKKHPLSTKMVYHVSETTDMKKECFCIKIISQISLSDDTQLENLGDLERLQRVIEYMPDKKLIRKPEAIRGKGRNEWPVAAMWNSLLAPGASAYTNFINNLRECRGELREVFDGLVSYMYENLPDFGDILMADGKAVQSFATKPSRKAGGHKGEHDADRCRKTYTTTTPTGEVNTKTVKWFGFRLHLIADASYELPVDFTVAKESASEVKETEKLLKKMKEKKPQKIKKCRYFPVNRGYDSTELIEWLETDKRILTRTAGNSKKWKRLYAMRSGIGRINGRIDRDYRYLCKKSFALGSYARIKHCLEMPKNCTAKLIENEKD